jgi:hypothetical protein
MTSQHGTNGMYAMKCRCEDCTRAHRDYMRAWKELQVDKKQRDWARREVLRLAEYQYRVDHEDSTT